MPGTLCGTTDRRLVRRIMLSYSIVFTAMQFANSLTMLADGGILGYSLGPTALAAIGLAGPSFQMIQLLSGLFALGTQLLCTEAMVAGDRERANAVFSGTCILAGLLAAATTVPGLLFTEEVCTLLGADGSDPALRECLLLYLRSWFVGIPGFLFFWILSPLAILDNNKKLVAAATVVQSVVNIGGDLLAVTVLKNGVQGVGLATGIGWDLATLLLICGFLRKRSVFRFRLTLPGRKLLGRQFVLSSPKLFRYFCRVLASLLINRLVLSVGSSAAMSAISLKTQLLGCCAIFGEGIADAVSITSQVFYQERDLSSLRRMARLAICFDLVTSAALAALLFLYAGPIAELCMPDGTLEYTYAVTALRCLAGGLVFRAFNSAICSYLQGIKRVRYADLHMFIILLLAPVTSTALLGHLFGPNGLFYAVGAAELLGLLLYLVVAMIGGHGKNFLDRVLLLPKSYTEGVEALILPIRNQEEAQAVSLQVESFLTGLGIDRRRCFFASLCMEELATNVISHGFTKDKRSHSCEVLILHDHGALTFRLRDDCKAFDIRERYRLMQDGPVEKGIGIRLVCRLAGAVYYTRLLNTNTLTIQI